MVRASHAFLVGSIAMFLVAIISFLGGWTAARTMGTIPLSTFVSSTFMGDTPEGTPAELDDQFAVFWDVWGLVHSEFYHTEPLDQQRMVYGSIRGMLAALGDDYTLFQEPEAAERSHESMQGSFEGIGVYMNFVENEVIVERPIKGSPAMKAGLQSGDIIVSVDGTDLAPLLAEKQEHEATDAVAKLIRGPKGSVVNLSIRRPPETTPFDVSIVRDEVPLISVHAQMLNERTAYIQLTEFKASTTQELDEALRQLLPQQPAALVLDLRNNPGGLLTTAQEVLGRFYEGVALYEEMSDGSEETFHTISAPQDVRAFDIPLLVLVNGNSASASEIVAGALRDMRPNTTLLGETTFGKGSVQNIHRLSDGSSVRITIAHWFTPNRDEIHKIGITPEYIVGAAQDPQYAVPCTEGQQPPEGQTTCSDAQLSWGLQFLESGAAPPPPPPASTAE
jgi:carboxyl-terminal processing protease